MIKLKKIEKPQILIDNAANWTEEYCQCLKEGRKPNDTVKNRYNHEEIKSALEKETNQKCAYCESKFKHISYGDIEHILPKNKDAKPELYVEWSNLTLACELCNRSGKRTYYDPDLPLVNPYNDEPTDYLLDIGSLIMPILGNDRGIITEKILKLNRPSLVERRTEKLKNIESLLQAWAREGTPSIKKVLENELHEEYSPNKEYSSTVKSFLSMHGFPVKNQ